jgi:hypothetical protein
MEVNYRRCAACRRIAHKRDFWRIVRAHPDHEIYLDQGMGRSAYLCQTEACLKAIQKKNRLGKLLKTSSVPDSLFNHLRGQLHERSVKSLS